MLLNSSQEMCGDEPTPEEATVKLSGLAFAVAISWAPNAPRMRGHDEHLRTKHHACNWRQVARETKLQVAVEYFIP